MRKLSLVCLAAAVFAAPLSATETQNFEPTSMSALLDTEFTFDRETTETIDKIARCLVKRDRADAIKILYVPLASNYQNRVIVDRLLDSRKRNCAIYNKKTRVPPAVMPAFLSRALWQDAMPSEDDSPSRPPANSIEAFAKCALKSDDLRTSVIQVNLLDPTSGEHFQNIEASLPETTARCGQYIDNAYISSKSLVLILTAARWLHGDADA